MSDSPAPTETPVQNATINGLAQYVKDFSFENPNAPQSLQPQETGPAINIQVNVNAKPMDGTDFEVDLKLEGTAKVGEMTLFAFDLTYSGLFRLMNIPQEHHHPAVMIECPRLLFPFARQIIAEAVRDGGFPPLYIDPIDFQGLYQHQIAAGQGQVAAPDAAPLH